MLNESIIKLKPASKKMKTIGMGSEIPFHIMLLPGLIFTLVFSYIPMAGLVMAFQKFNPGLGFLKSKWVGFFNFTYVFKMDDFLNVIWNTFYISFCKVILGIIIPLVLALLINEVVNLKYKKFIQSSIFIPYFLSWVVMGGLIKEMFSLDGMVNTLIHSLTGVEPIFFMVSNKWYPFIVIITDVWKNMGYTTVIYLATITNINPNLYEAASVDGAGKLKQVFFVTLPGMLPIIILLSTLSIGSILNAGFEQILVTYNPLVYKSSDIIDTFVYRLGLLNGEFSPAAAIGFFKSAVSTVLVSLSYYMAYKFNNYRIF